MATSVLRASPSSWLARFHLPGERPPVVATELLDAATTWARDPTRSDFNDTVHEPAWSIGVLRAQQGRVSAGLVQDVLMLRPVLWAVVSPGAAGDAGAMLLAHQRLTDLVDEVLHCAVDAYVEESRRVLSVRATRDQLTGLLNRAAFDDALDREVAAADGRSAPPALLLVDLDGFKGVNDALGHLAGDDVLTAVAAVLLTRVRKGDVVARVGGDEFAVLLPRMTLDGALDRARRLVRTADTASGLAPKGAPRKVGLSVGVTNFAGPPDKVYAAADTAMYEAKRSGGRQARAYTPPVGPAPAPTPAGDGK